MWIKNSTEEVVSINEVEYSTMLNRCEDIDESIVTFKSHRMCKGRCLDKNNARCITNNT